MKLYETVDVWRRVSKNELVRYRCFRNLQTKRYSVQSSDFYKLPMDLKRATFLEKQYLELLAEQAPDDRAASFDTLSEAIQVHEQAFSQS
jgi:hypothetical protein